MSRYILKPTVPGRIYEIRLAGAKFGCVRKMEDGQFIAFTTGSGPMRRATAGTANHAFEDLVAQLNRIALCGEDDTAKARAALAERNARIERMNAEDRKAMQPLRELFEDALGVRLPERRATFKRVRI